MIRIRFCIASILFCLLTANFVDAQTSPQEDGRLRTLPESESDAPEPGPNASRRINQVEALLANGDFDRLDQIADKARSQKTRSAGGAWRLKVFYQQLNTKEEAAQDPNTHRQQLEAWIAAKPESITARIGLAEFYHNFAWVARGTSSAENVPDSAWPVFKERAKKSEEILNQAAKLTQKCPEWYAAMQIVALALDWDNGKARRLFEQAVQFEPDYQYYYESYANYLLPKWDGKEHDAVVFAQKSADTLGGERGDILYFDIAGVIVRRGNGISKPEMDWGRLQRGHAALESAYGITSGEQNRFAFMAFKFQDAAVAQKEFAAIGEKWSLSVWRTHGYFQKARDWAAGKPQS